MPTKKKTERTSKLYKLLADMGACDTKENFKNLTLKKVLVQAVKPGQTLVTPDSLCWMLGELGETALRHKVVQKGFESRYGNAASMGTPPNCVCDLKDEDIARVVKKIGVKKLERLVEKKLKQLQVS